ncbi:MAG TPA: hypothetical protein VFA07_12840 [Chthonomonadaceae bacterium]|nr:hypothetical protein [Chthonomonadaceae bacterium]
MSEFEIGYIMGLIVGEGSFTGDRVQPCLSVTLQLGDRMPLDTLQQHLGGRVNGPYDKNGSLCYDWKLRGPELRASIPLFNKYLPPSRKRRQFEAWCEKWFPYLLKYLNRSHES